MVVACYGKKSVNVVSAVQVHEIGGGPKLIAPLRHAEQYLFLPAWCARITKMVLLPRFPLQSSPLDCMNVGTIIGYYWNILEYLIISGRLLQFLPQNQWNYTQAPAHQRPGSPWITKSLQVSWGTDLAAGRCWESDRLRAFVSFQFNRYRVAMSGS